MRLINVGVSFHCLADGNAEIEFNYRKKILEKVVISGEGRGNNLNVS